MLVSTKKIAIIGAGPGGLTLATLLQQKGVNIRVYERDKDQNARVQGAPLDLHEQSGLAALRAAGLIEEFKKNFMPGADRMQIMNEKAEVLYSDHHQKVEEDFDNPYFRPEIDRGTLRKILLQSLPAETIIWDSHFITMEKQGAGWLLHFRNNHTEYADIVIAADGANSKIRPLLTDITPFYTGITMLEGTIENALQQAPAIHALLKGGKIMAYGNNKNLLLGQKGNGEIGFYASLRLPKDWASNSGLQFDDNKQIVEWFKETYSEWNPIWKELFTSTNTFTPRPIYCMPLDQSWEPQANVTLLGDAAHVMPPFAGEGVNMAMLDALELSQKLTDPTFLNLTDAITAYEKSMRTRTAVIALESIENGEKMHAENALSTMLDFFNSH